MKIRRFADALLCASIAAMTAMIFSGCKDADLQRDTAGAVSITESVAAETEAFSPIAEAEPTETSPQPNTEEQTYTEETVRAEETASDKGTSPTETDTPPQTAETELTETTLSETAQTEEAAAKTESSPPQTNKLQPEEAAVTEAEADKLSVDKEGSYTTPEDVAEYIHTFGTLPKNFITKSEAKNLGWDSSKGNLWDVAEGKSIGGDRFGNYEGLLPEADGRKYTECDVNYVGGFRGGERLVFSNDGLIYYTNDHYQTFTRLY